MALLKEDQNDSKGQQVPIIEDPFVEIIRKRDEEEAKRLSQLGFYDVHRLHITEELRTALDAFKKVGPHKWDSNRRAEMLLSKLAEDHLRLRGVTFFEEWGENRDTSRLKVYRHNEPAISIVDHTTICAFYTIQDLVLGGERVARLCPVQKATFSQDTLELRAGIGITSYHFGNVWPLEKVLYALTLPNIGKETQVKVGTQTDELEAPKPQCFKEEDYLKQIILMAPPRGLGTIIENARKELEQIGLEAFNELFGAYSHLKTLENALGNPEAPTAYDYESARRAYSLKVAKHLGIDVGKEIETTREK